MAIDVAIVMGSESDLPLVSGAFEVLDQFNIGYSVRVISTLR